MLKVLFAGTPDVAVPSLKMLAEDTEHFEVVAVLTRPDAPTGRGRKLVPNPVKQAALELGLPVIESVFLHEEVGLHVAGPPERHAGFPVFRTRSLRGPRRYTVLHVASCNPAPYRTRAPLHRVALWVIVILSPVTGPRALAA